MAPMRPVMATNTPAMEYPIQTHSHDCHHERPATIMEDEIIHVLMLKASEIQNATNDHEVHSLLLGSTGLRSSLIS